MKVLAIAMLGVLAVLVVVAAWVAAPTTHPPPRLWPRRAATPTASASPSQLSAAPTPGAEPTDPPTSAGRILGGTWVMPTAGTRLTSSTTTLSARPTGDGPGGTTITKVVFSGAWPGSTRTVMCKANRPADSGEWRCRADLLALGVPPGKVTFTFDVYGEGVPAARTPDGRRRVTYAVPPPKPTDPRLKDLGGVGADTGITAETYRVSWSAAAGYADEFLIYNTWECPLQSTKKAGARCFVAGTPVDASQLELLRTAQGDARSAKIARTYECGPPYGTILLRARNAYGRSAFTVVESARVPNPNDIIC